MPVVIYDPLERMQEIGEKQGWLIMRNINSLFVLQKSLKNKLFKIDNKENTISQHNKLVDSIFH